VLGGVEPPHAASGHAASFDLERTAIENETESYDRATMTLKGVCSYDPTTKKLSDIEIREWSKSGPSWGIMSADKTALARQYDPARIRRIS
jgi:hypothetical protein